MQKIIFYYWKSFKIPKVPSSAYVQMTVLMQLYLLISHLYQYTFHTYTNIRITRVNRTFVYYILNVYRYIRSWMYHIKNDMRNKWFCNDALISTSYCSIYVETGKEVAVGHAPPISGSLLVQNESIAIEKYSDKIFCTPRQEHEIAEFIWLLISAGSLRESLERRPYVRIIYRPSVNIILKWRAFLLE